MEKKGEINKSEYCAEKKSRDGSGAASVGGRERGGREYQVDQAKIGSSVGSACHW